MVCLSLLLGACADLEPVRETTPVRTQPVAATPPESPQPVAATPAESPQPAPAEPSLDEAIAPWIAGSTVDKSIAVELAALPRIPVELEAGRCYVQVLRLADGSQWSPSAVANVFFEYGGEMMKVNAGPGRIGRGAVARLGCQPRAHRFALRIWTAGEVLGRGAATLELYGRPATEAELEHEERSTREAAERGAHDRDEHRRQVCGRCRTEYGATARDFRTCLIRSGIPTDACP
jgi:hypothetical protein